MNHNLHEHFLYSRATNYFGFQGHGFNGQGHIKETFRNMYKTAEA